MPALAAQRMYFSSGAAVSHGPVSPSPFPAWQWQSMIMASLKIAAAALRARGSPSRGLWCLGHEWDDEKTADRLALLPLRAARRNDPGRQGLAAHDYDFDPDIIALRLVWIIDVDVKSSW